MARGRSSSSSSSLAPGFRFHPTDEELVRYYLKRKITNKPFRFDAISVTDIYKSEPWDLPGKSTLKSRDLEWYFFSVLDRKYGNGSKTNRATEKGYWKTTGKDRAIKCNSRTIGMKKTLVYHLGRAPRGERSNWVMHEYRLVDEQLQKTGISQDAFVVCRVFQKSGTGLKNGEQYGAPFVEEEWEDDEEEVAMLFGGETEAVAEEVAVGDDAYAQAIDFDQILNPVAMASGDAPLPLNYHHGETSNYVEQLENFSEDDQKPLIGGGDISEDDQKPLIGGGENQYGSDLPDRQNLYQSRQYEVDEKTIKDENVADPGFVSANDVDGTYWLDEPYFNATDNPSFSEGLFLEANDLSIPVELESAENNSGYDMVDEYLNFFDTTDDFTFDLSEVFGSENAVSDQGHPSQKDTKEGVTVGIQTHNVNDASSSKELPDVYKTDPDYKYPFIKQASHMLGSFPAPPAFASEFPTKEAALRLSAAQASTSIHVTAGMMRIEKNMALASNGIEWSFAKNGNINIIVSFGLSHGDTNRIISSSKIASMVSRRWLYLMFFWVMLLTVGYKIGIYICAK